MVRVQLSERQWSKIEAFLRSERRAGRPAHDDRKFVEAVLWWKRTTRMTCATRLPRRDVLRLLPPRQAAHQKLPYDKQLYKARSEVECTINLLKQARRFATRYEKTLRNYAAVVALGCALLWLRI